LTTDVQGDDQSKAPALQRGVSFCTGTIISPRVILTAAHCVQEFDPASRQKGGLLFPNASDFLVYFGTQVKNDESYIRAAKVVPHPEWDPAATLQPFPRTAPNDIAILVLSQDIPKGYEPVQIADPSLSLDNEQAALAGFGVPFSRSIGNTGTLRQVDVRVTGVNTAAKRFSVGALFRGACAGDSGGPAFIKVGDEFQLVGATSTGAELLTACIGVINNYTDARQYKSWIASVSE
jgi:secreted trypsin-like serine protease